MSAERDLAAYGEGATDDDRPAPPTDAEVAAELGTTPRALRRFLRRNPSAGAGAVLGRWRAPPALAPLVEAWLRERRDRGGEPGGWSA